MSGHTATPWRISGLIDARYLRGIGEVMLVRCDRTGDDRYIAMCSLDAMGDGSEICTSPDERQANAAFIVTACNSHADLVKALEAVQRWAQSKCPCENEKPDPCPLCGARVDGGDVCKAVDSTFPTTIREAIDAALATLTARKVG